MKVFFLCSISFILIASNSLSLVSFISYISPLYYVIFSYYQSLVAGFSKGLFKRWGIHRCYTAYVTCFVLWITACSLCFMSFRIYYTITKFRRQAISSYRSIFVFTLCDMVLDFSFKYEAVTIWRTNVRPKRK